MLYLTLTYWIWNKHLFGSKNNDEGETMYNELLLHQAYWYDADVKDFNDKLSAGVEAAPETPAVEDTGKDEPRVVELKEEEKESKKSK